MELKQPLLRFFITFAERLKALENEIMMSIAEALKDPRNHWQAIATLLIYSSADVSLPSVGPIPWIPGWLSRLTPTQIAEADQVAMLFHEKLKWPKLQGDLRYQLFFRTMCASEYAMEQSRITRPPPSDLVPWAKTLPWLLIDIWRSEGQAWAKKRFPFEGRSPGKLSKPPFANPEDN